jgi:serine/threonine protein kinase
MKLFIQIFKDGNFGNCRFDVIVTPNNKITVLELKQILYGKYGIKKENQRLSVKMCNKQFVIMTNEYPLNFFFIKERSIIYLEYIHSQTKTEEISKKIIRRDIKSKYLKSLGILQRFPPMEIIKESMIEDIDDETRNSFHKKHIPKEFCKQIQERLNKAIMGNNLDIFREIMDNHYKFIDINKPIDKFQKYSAIHYAALYGYFELMKDLIDKYKADINLVSLDKWSALHLSSHKGFIEIVNLLIHNKDINCDLCLPKIGTALHCACKKNNFKVVSLLLHKCDPRIPNDDGKLPIELTSDYNIKKLLNKIMNPSSHNNLYPIKMNNNEETDLKVKNDKNSNFNINDSKFLFLKNLKDIPNQPPKYIGFLYKKGKILPHYNLRYGLIDPLKGQFIRFAQKSDYPTKPLEIIQLKDFISSKITNDISKSYFYLDVTFSSNQLFRFESIKPCNEWNDAINKCSEYSKYWDNLSLKYPEASSYLNTLDSDVIEINWYSGETTLIESKKKEEVNSKKKKQRRKNPYTNYDEDFKLLENTILNKNSIGFNSFTILDCLGEGSFGKVFKVRMKSNGEIYAMKVLNKKFLIKNNQLKYAITECNVLKQAASPFLLTLYYSFQTPDNLYMIIDYCPGGDLNFHIIQNLFEEDEAKFYIAELILAIEHLHELDIIYRDLKPENILISQDNHIKLADFGLAKEGIADQQSSKSFVGSPAYLPPEMLNRKGVGKSADIYGIGAVLYEMMCGTPPFFSNNIKILYRNISQSKLMLHDYFSDELKDLLTQLLCRDPYKRIGVQDKKELKCHEWFKDIDWEKLAKKEIEPPLDLVEIKKKLDTLSENELKTNFEDKDYTNENKMHKRISNFTFIKLNHN